MTQPSAKIITDSISPAGDRLTTMEVVCHRFVLAEFNTHRMFSRNSASSRAIPVKKQLEKVKNDPALPLVWASEQAGMQGGEALSGPSARHVEQWWLTARDQAVEAVEALVDVHLHKSVANRLLEPFMWHTIVVSATEWDNFFGLRCNPMAQPEIQAVAYAMRDALEGSPPIPLVAYGEWHMPYIKKEDWDWADVDVPSERYIELLKHVSAARCARVSYLTQDGVRDPEKDIELYTRLVSADPPHSSPLEHVATPQGEMRDGRPYLTFEHKGNFKGWNQLRHLEGK